MALRSTHHHLGASTSRNPMGLHSLLQGSLYFLLPKLDELRYLSWCSDRLQAWWTKNWGFIPSRNERFLSCAQCLEQLWGLPSLLSIGTRGSLLGCKSDPWLPSGGKFKNGSVPPLVWSSSWHGAFIFLPPRLQYIGTAIVARHSNPLFPAMMVIDTNWVISWTVLIQTSYLWRSPSFETF
jgi:hypothetical protein